MIVFRLWNFCWLKLACSSRRNAFSSSGLAMKGSAFANCALRLGAIAPRFRLGDESPHRRLHGLDRLANVVESPQLFSILARQLALQRASALCQWRYCTQAGHSGGSGKSPVWCRLPCSTICCLRWVAGWCCPTGPSLHQPLRAVFVGTPLHSLQHHVFWSLHDVHHLHRDHRVEKRLHLHPVPRLP